MTNKELAVQLYIANRQMRATLATNPKYCGTVHIDSDEEAVQSIAAYAQKLSRIDDDGFTLRS